MLNSRAFDYRIWVTLLLCFAFGLAFNISIPYLENKPFFILIIPLTCLFFILLVVKSKETLAGLLLVRPVLDSTLNKTQTDTGSVHFGAGAFLNIAIIFLLIFFIFSHKNNFKNNPVIKCWILYLMILFAAVCYSPYLGTAIRLFIENLTYFSMFMIPILIVKTHKDIKFWLKIIAASFILPIIFGNIDLLFWHGHYYADAGQRIEGSFEHPNVLAFFMVLGLTFYFFLIQSKIFNLNRGKIYFCIGLMINMFILLIATKTRNAWIACFISFFVYGLLKDKKLLISICLLPFLLLLIPSFNQRIMNIFDSSIGVEEEFQGRNSYQWREEVWQSSMPLILQKPLQGYGLTSFQPMFEKFSNLGSNMGSHNVYLELLFECGIFGLISFIMIFAALLRIFWLNTIQTVNLHSSKLSAIIFSYVLSYLVICYADNLLYYLAFNWYVWFLLGIFIKYFKLLSEPEYI